MPGLDLEFGNHSCRTRLCGLVQGEKVDDGMRGEGPACPRAFPLGVGFRV